ncbi:hypothetical protein VPH35_101284 [Triticum aestivum]
MAAPAGRLELASASAVSALVPLRPFLSTRLLRPRAVWSRRSRSASRVRPQSASPSSPASARLSRLAAAALGLLPSCWLPASRLRPPPGQPGRLPAPRPPAGLPRAGFPRAGYSSARRRLPRTRGRLLHSRYTGCGAPTPPHADSAARGRLPRRPAGCCRRRLLHNRPPGHGSLTPACSPRPRPPALAGRSPLAGYRPPTPAIRLLVKERDGAGWRKVGGDYCKEEKEEKGSVK